MTSDGVTESGWVATEPSDRDLALGLEPKQDPPIEISSELIDAAEMDERWLTLDGRHEVDEVEAGVPMTCRVAAVMVVVEIRMIATMIKTMKETFPVSGCDLREWVCISRWPL